MAVVKRVLQRQKEIILHQGTDKTLRFKIFEQDGTTRVGLTGATNISLKVFEFLDSAIASISKSGSVFTDAPSDQLEFTFAVSDSSALVPKTYVYAVSFTTSAGDTGKTGKDNFTILRSLA